MPPEEKLSNAPIAEGLIDITLAEVSLDSIEPFQQLAESLARDFPLRQVRSRWEGEIQLTPGLPPNVAGHSQKPDGVVARSADGLWVVQFRLDGFTMSRLKPYTSWNDLLGKAKPLWAQYRNLVAEAKVARVATRFVNLIPIRDDEQLENVFTTSIRLGAGLPQLFRNYLLRVAIPFDEDIVGLLTQTISKSGEEYVLDLEAFSQSTDGFIEDDLWSQLASLRKVKNKLFFDSLSETGLARFR